MQEMSWQWILGTPGPAILGSCPFLPSSFMMGGGGLGGRGIAIKCPLWWGPCKAISPTSDSSIGSVK